MSVIKLDIVVNDLAAMLALYNRIEVHRSITVEGGPYVEITDPVGPTAAVLDGVLDAWGNLSGEVLSFHLDGEEDPTVVTLPILDPMPLQAIIDAINEEVEDVASEVPTDTNRLRLTSPTTGTGSSIVILVGAVATALGLDTTKVNGKERRTRLIDPTTLYAFYDKDGADDFWYKTRFSNTENANISDFSDARQGNIDVIIPSAQLVTGSLTLVDGLGRPVVGRRLTFIPMTSKMVPTTTAWVVPGFDARVEVLTNEAGFASANLLQGQTYRVIIEGTSLMREFTAPSNAVPFDIMTIIGSAPDPFDIVQSPPRPIKVTI